jgi:hypothetical protein
MFLAPQVDAHAPIGRESKPQPRNSQRAKDRPLHLRECMTDKHAEEKGEDLANGLEKSVSPFATMKAVAGRWYLPY